jgi:pyrroline-5-carboxylate reductase
MLSIPTPRIAILGAGNIGTAIAGGLVRSGRYRPVQIALTRRKVHLLGPFIAEGYAVTQDNAAAIGESIICIAPRMHHFWPQPDGA